MLRRGQATDDYLLVMLWVSVLEVSHNMWSNELVGGGLCHPTAFLVQKCTRLKGELQMWVWVFN